jgi:hypothetical protein
VNVSGVGPDGTASGGVELSEEATDHLVGVSLGAQSIDLSHHPSQCLLDVVDGALGISVALLLEAALTLDEFLAIELEEVMENRIALRTRIGQEA